MNLGRVAWLVTVSACLVAVLILILDGYYGYAGVTLAVAISAGINLLLSGSRAYAGSRRLGQPGQQLGHRPGPVADGVLLLVGELGHRATVVVAVGQERRVIAKPARAAGLGRPAAPCSSRRTRARWAPAGST